MITVHGRQPGWHGNRRLEAIWTLCEGADMEGRDPSIVAPGRRHCDGGKNNTQYLVIILIA